MRKFAFTLCFLLPSVYFAQEVCSDDVCDSEEMQLLQTKVRSINSALSDSKEENIVKKIVDHEIAKLKEIASKASNTQETSSSKLLPTSPFLQLQPWPVRLKAAWRQTASFLRLGKTEASFKASKLQATSEIVDDPMDVAWLTIIPCVLIGLGITAMISMFFHSTFIAEPTKEIEHTTPAGEAGVKGMTEFQLMINMVKNIVGEGMLSLPAGIAGGTGLMIGSLIAFAFATLMGYTFCIMGRVCHATGGTTHKECGTKVGGKLMGEMMAIILMLKTMFTCLTYAIVIGESFSRILHFFGVQGFFASSAGVLLLFTVLVLLPLCLQKDLSVLSYTSGIGVCGQVWVVIIMFIRYIDQSYAPGGKYHDLIPEKDQPDFSGGGVLFWNTSAATFVLLGSLSTAFIAHYNAPKFYCQLQDATPEKFCRVVGMAFGTAMVIYFWIMSVGYLTFGKAAEGLILNNYSEKDALATSARISIGFAVTFAFPLGFTGLRDSTMSVFGLDSNKFLPVTLTLLSIITAGGCTFHDLGLANSLGGAIFGSLITLVFPGLLCYCAGQLPDAKEFSPYEWKYLSLVVIALGSTLMVFGSTLVIVVRYFPELLGR